MHVLGDQNLKGVRKGREQEDETWLTYRRDGEKG